MGNGKSGYRPPEKSAEGGPKESFQSYSSQCSLPALAQILASDMSPQIELDIVLETPESPVLEPLAMLILTLSTETGGARGAGEAESVSVCSGNALPAGREPGEEER